MKKNEPKMILNLSIDDDEFDKKIKIATEQYVDKLIRKDLDEEIAKYVNKRIDVLISGTPSWSPDRKIQGMYFGEFIKSKTEQAIIDVIEKNAKEILAKKLASLI